jgi:hypothetical protein
VGARPVVAGLNILAHFFRHGLKAQKLERHEASE